MRKQHRIVDLAASPRLPAICEVTEFADAEGLNVDKILKGAKPADRPVQQPTKFEP